MSLRHKKDEALIGFPTSTRRPLRIAPDQLIKNTCFDSQEAFPLLLEPAVSDLNLAAWLESNIDFIKSELLKHGAILIRNFNVATPELFAKCALAISGHLLNYNERAAPRREVGQKIYTSTEYPADQYIPLHHEMSYSHNSPQKIWFYCDRPAEQGGNTPIANDRKVFNLIPGRIKERFMDRKVMYLRNYGEGVNLSWQEAFQTEDKSVVEEYCKAAGIMTEWRDNNRLRTRQIRQAVAKHPETGEPVWFNHAHLFHTSNLEAAVRDSLLLEFAEDELPRNAFYGDGSSIEASILEEIREIYRCAAVNFSWRQGDILLLDNFLAVHGREPYTGPRSILVAMAELVNVEEHPLLQRDDFRNASSSE